MTAGTIKIAEYSGVFVIKMEGDVRLTLCLSFDEFIEEILQRPNYASVIFDLIDAHAIDSTTLGLMAKFSIKAGHHHLEPPLVISNNPSITRILVSMGFDDIFRMVEKSEFESGRQRNSEDSIVMVEQNGNETEVRKKVLEAHKYLMDLNDGNQQTFKELVETLEGCK